MGNVVALSSFEFNRGSERKNRSGKESAEVILFTGVRYERMGNLEEARSFKDRRTHLNLGRPVNSKS